MHTLTEVFGLWANRVHYLQTKGYSRQIDVSHSEKVDEVSE